MIKVMRVLLFDVFQHLLLRKTDVLKIGILGNVNFSERKFEEML